MFSTEAPQNSALFFCIRIVLHIWINIFHVFLFSALTEDQDQDQSHIFNQARPKSPKSWPQLWIKQRQKWVFHFFKSNFPPSISRRIKHCVQSLIDSLSLEIIFFNLRMYSMYKYTACDTTLTCCWIRHSQDLHRNSLPRTDPNLQKRKIDQRRYGMLLVGTPTVSKAQAPYHAVWLTVKTLKSMMWYVWLKKLK